VGTATGAEIQKSIPLRTTPKYRNQHIFVQSYTVAVCKSQDQVGGVALHVGAVVVGQDSNGQPRAYTITEGHLGRFRSGPEVARAIPNVIGSNNTEAPFTALAR